MEAQKSSPSKINMFNIKSHKILRVKTIEKESDLPQKILPTKNMSLGRIRINSMKFTESSKKIQKIRKYTQVEEDLREPLSPLKFNPFKQCKKFFIFKDQSKLKLSAETWVLYDMKNDQYKRGWRPNQVSPFYGLLRIAVLFFYCQIIDCNPSLKFIRVKLNTAHLKQSKLKIKKQQKRLKWLSDSKKTSKTFSKGTIILLMDIIKGMIITGNQDLLQYAIIYCGYLLTLFQNNIDWQKCQPFISIDQEKKQDLYSEIFCRHCNQVVFKQNLNLKDSKVESKDQNFEFISTPNQICHIFLKGFQKFVLFNKIIPLQRTVCPIRFQVGFNYWQDRTMILKSKKQDLQSDYLCFLVYKGLRNYEAVCYNKTLQILMIIEDSKFAMADLDIKILQKWFIGITKPAIQRNNSSSLSPIKRKTIFPILQISKN